MTALVPQSLSSMTVEDFLVWSETVEGVWELHDGIPVPKRGENLPVAQAERLAHSRAKFRTSRALADAIDARNLPCESLPGGASVRAADETVYIPDALIRWGEALADDTIIIPDPVVIVEVLSRSNTAAEMTAKTDRYFMIPTVMHVLLTDTDRREVLHYRRGEGTSLIVRRMTEGEEISLDPLGLSVAVADLLPFPAA